MTASLKNVLSALGHSYPKRATLLIRNAQACRTFSSGSHSPSPLSLLLEPPSLENLNAKINNLDKKVSGLVDHMDKIEEQSKKGLEIGQNCSQEFVNRDNTFKTVATGFIIAGGAFTLMMTMLRFM